LKIISKEAVSKNMNIAVFDIDGTLTQTCNRYDEYYAQAVEEAVGVSISRSWSDYVHSTDSGIMHEVCIRDTGLPPRVDQIAAAQKRYLRKLKVVCTGGEAIAGAGALIEVLASSSFWAIALATGNWATAARFKMSRAGLAADSIPWATADDALDRKEIITLAIGRSAKHLGLSGFDRIVYLGDAAWDLSAAHALGLAFVRRGSALSDGQNQLLPSHSLADFLDQRAVLEALESASVPRRIEMKTTLVRI
jgi:beta-phosphoglucomutase-like phosphatase (HAD superfamily)